jgi:hypothetical protein
VRSAATTVALAACAAAIASQAPATAAARQDDLLRRFAPVLRYDHRERDRTTAVDAIESRLGDREAVRLAGERPGREVVYGHAVRGADGSTWLQYWLFLLGNRQDRGILGTGRHEGDWELVQLRLGAGGRPDLATLTEHSWAEGCPARGLERAGAAPVVYVANGSHALYSRAGTHDRPFPDPNDEADGRGRRVRPPVVAIDDGTAWTRWPGRWGASEAGIVPGEQSSPRGPAFQDGDPWRRPAAFHEARARPCGSGPPGRPWQAPALAALAAAAALAATLIRRRSRRARHLQSPP